MKFWDDDSVNGDVVESEADLAVAIGVKRRQGGDGQWGCNEVTVQRAVNSGQWAVAGEGVGSGGVGGAQNNYGTLSAPLFGVPL